MEKEREEGGNKGQGEERQSRRTPQISHFPHSAFWSLKEKQGFRPKRDSALQRLKQSRSWCEHPPQLGAATQAAAGKEQSS